jgi:hypothetical protein
MSLKLSFQERKEGAMFLKMESFLCFQMHHTTTVRISMKKLCPKAPLAASIMAPMYPNIVLASHTEGTIKKKMISCFFMTLIVENTVDITAFVQKTFFSQDVFRVDSILEH